MKKKKEQKEADATGLMQPQTLAKCERTIPQKVIGDAVELWSSSIANEPPRANHLKRDGRWYYVTSLTVKAFQSNIILYAERIGSDNTCGLCSRAVVC